MKIGELELRNKVILAPLAGVTDRSFRLLAVEMGCALVFTEMVSAKGIICAPQQALANARFTDFERPIAIQLFGSDPDVLAEGAQVAADLQPEIIDLNMGCPVKKVVSKGEGCALMRDPEKVFAIVRAVSGAVPMPVTVKIRKGWDDDALNAVEVARAAQEGGATAVTVHGRTRAQGYSGLADWRVIADVKAALQIPVIGNGDILQPEDAKRMLIETGCDAVMLARGTMGNLWLIERTVHYLQTGDLLPAPDAEKKAALAKRHLAMMVEAKGEFIGVREMRKHVAWYLKGIHGAAKIRNRIIQAKTQKEMIDILNDLSGQ